MEKDIYPKTGLYRENREDLLDVESDAFNDWQKIELRTRLHEMFDDIDATQLTPEQIKDIENFVRFALHKLAVAELNSEAFKNRAAHMSVLEAVNNMSFKVQGVGHDSMHALVAWLGSKGRSFAPTYISLNHGPADVDSVLRLTSLQEEVYVFMFVGYKKLQERLSDAFASDSLATKELILCGIPDDEIRNLLALKESDPESFAIRFCEITCSFSRKSETAEFIKNYRFPEMHTYLKAVYKDLEVRDPNFTVNQFLLMAEPLLQKLRK